MLSRLVLVISDLGNANKKKLTWQRVTVFIWVSVYVYVCGLLIQRAVYLCECTTSVFPGCDAWHLDAVELVMAVPLVTKLIVRTETEWFGDSQVLVKWPKLHGKAMGGKKSFMLAVFSSKHLCADHINDKRPSNPVCRQNEEKCCEGVEVGGLSEQISHPEGHSGELAQPKSMVSSGLFSLALS